MRSSSVEIQKILTFLILTSSFPQDQIAAAEPCTVCTDSEPISIPDKNFTIEGLPINNCQSLSTAAGFLEVGTPFCDSIQSIGTLCGCDYDEENSCSLCHDGSSVTNPLNEIPGYLAEDFVVGAPPKVLMNCESLEAVLHQQAKDTLTCIDAQNYAFEYCGCPEPPDMIVVTNGTSSSSSSSSNDTSVVDEIEFCSVCLDGEAITLPDRPMVVDGLPIESCSDVVDFVGFLEADSAECIGIQMIGTYCGCTYKQYDVTICPDGSDIPYPDVIMAWLGDGYISAIPDDLSQFADSLTCGIFEAALQNFDDSYGGVQHDFLVTATQMRSGVCGCSHGWRAKLLTWSNRVAGILSLIGSVVISTDILSSRKKRVKTYHQLVLGMSLFDIISSTAYTASTSMISPDSGLYQSSGSDGTCTLQGFMIQFGLTSCFFNAMLATYFMLAATRGWKESTFVKFRHWAYVLAVLVGLGMAIAGLRFYTPLLAFCYVSVPPVTSTWVPISLLFTVPVSLSIFVATVSLILICRRVFQVEIKAMRWLTRRDAALAKKVCYRTFFYLLSFNVTLPCLMLSFYIGGRTAWGGYSLFLATGIMGPLQGLLNACVYYHRQGKNFTFGVIGIVYSYLHRIIYKEKRSIGTDIYDERDSEFE